MSGEQRRPEAPKGPLWSLDLLADYHAGVLDEDTAKQVGLALESDPEAQETLAALTATTNELSGLAPMPIPEDVASKVESAIAEQAQLRTGVQPPEAQPSSRHAEEPAAGPGDQSNVIDIRRRRRRRMSWGALLVASAAVIGGVVTTPLIINSTENTSAQPEQSEAGSPPPDSAPHVGRPTPLALSGAGSGNVTLTQQQFGETLQSQQYAGSLREPAQLNACLEANGVDNPRPLGAREVTVDGRPAQLFILSSGEVGQFRLLAVGTDCGPDRPETISDSTVGG